MGYSFRLAATVLLHTPSYRQDITYHGPCYTSRGTLAGKRNSSMCPQQGIDPTIHRTLSGRFYHGATSRSFICTLAAFLGFCITSCGALAVTINYILPPKGIDPTTHCTTSGRSTTELCPTSIQTKPLPS